MVDAYHRNARGQCSISVAVDFVIPTKEQSLLEAYKQWRERADEKVCCDYGLHVAITHWDEQVAKDMEILTKEKGLIPDILMNGRSL